MTTRFDCSLNGISLSGLDERICVTALCEDAPLLRLTELSLPGGGRRFLRRTRDSLSLHVSFAIHEPDSLLRQEIFCAVLSWADAGGTLTCPDRTGQQLQVICTALPVLHAEDWTETLQITFSTCCVPYWESCDVVHASTDGAVLLTLPGNAAAAPVDVHLVNHGSAPLTEATLTCGKTRITFSGLAIAPGETLTLHTTNDCLTAQANGEGILRCRTPESNDLLLAACGAACSASVSADQPVRAVFSGRGRYL